MSDCEETDFLWESWTPYEKRKKKRKKGLHKDKICSKLKNIITMKTNESIQKKKKNKKKNSKFKEAMEGRKEKKKDRKKKKNKLSLGLDDSFIFTQGYSGASDPVAKSEPEPSDPPSTYHLTHDSPDSLKKKTKRKKKVAFDLPPGYIRIKRPKFVTSSPKENTLPEKEAVRDTDSCSQVTVMGHSQAQPPDNDSQCTCSDDINSQDLFITQKTFRTMPSEPSSGETTQQEMVEPSSVVQKHYHEESNAHLQGSHFHEHPKKVNKHKLKPKAVQIGLTEEDFHLAEQNPKIQMELSTNLTEETTVSVKTHVANPYLDDPILLNCSMDVAKPKQISCTSNQKSPTSLLNTDRPSLLPWLSTASVSTQTENFFTTELSSYLNFYKKSGATLCFENLKPLDLSLPQRTRKDLDKFLSVKMSENEADEEKLSEQKQSLLEDMKGNSPKDPNLPPSCSSDTKVGLKQEPTKSEATPSHQSEPALKSADTTYSEDNEPCCRTGKVDLTQVRAVQMRLNESFFFKTKGEGQSPRPESPLIKLVQSRDMKSRKGQ